ncbi:hypothetical protein [Marinilabilia rubra]|uniref:Uncharacterized protein n=1 Tax=Marinilabilia rubra TaxID=2162893 RepID=A0A2U2B6F4_9BACT|nr:hypothetical protein [Marinilabilia rubra]PWD98658.1 hypothetical protein DDZ16_14450 [Marinilabilia rubra]
MKNISTMNLDVIINRSLYLQELLLNLPEDRLKEMLVSPREEFVESLKIRFKAVCDVRGRGNR